MTHHVNNEMKEDIYTWLFFLNRFNGITSYRQVDWANDCDLELFTDSAGNPDLGCGAVFGSHWVYLLWPQKWKSLNIFSDITFFGACTNSNGICSVGKGTSWEKGNPSYR